MNRNQKIITAFAAGAAIGGTLAILFAPQKGSETRQQMAAKAQALTDQLKDVIKKIVPACDSGKDKKQSAGEAS